MNKLILVTNDDSIHAKGIKELVSIAKTFGKVIVVAPDKPQSGMGHAITISNPLRIQKYEGFKDVMAYECSGTPVDCVKMGFYLLGDKSPDLILSGINHGSNVSTNVLYSGTMSAAVEGALEGIPSIGFSLTSHLPNADFSTSIKYVKKITEKVLNNGLKKGVCLNVNIPAINAELVKGIKVCRQGRAFWDDTFDKRTDPLGNEYYWLTGTFSSEEQGKDADVNFLKNNYVTIVPTQFDMTCYSSVEELNKWSF